MFPREKKKENRSSPTYKDIEGCISLRQSLGRVLSVPSKNMLRKGSRRQSVRAEYRATRGVEAEPAAVVPVLDLEEDTEIEDGVRSFEADAAAAGMRLDAIWRRRSRRSAGRGCSC